MSTTSVTSPQQTLTGSSTFASDLQSSLNRAVAIASLPMQLLQADQNQLTSKATELGQLNGLLSSVQSSLQALSSGTSNGSLSASVGDSSIVQANISGSPLPGTYSIDILNAGTAASAISAAPSTIVTDPSSQNISTSTAFTLTVGANTYNIQPAAQNLNSLASAINSSGAAVQAVVVNLGSPTAPSYQLVVQSSTLGNVGIQLNDGHNNLLASLTPGSNASYTVNGQPPGGISTNTATVTIAPGLNVTIEKAGITNVTVAASLNGVSNALSNFVSAYNAAVTELQKNRGQSGGALTGDSIIQGMQQALSHIVNYTGAGGSIISLTQLGVQFTSTGTLTFDSTAISSLSQSQITDALSFLGNPTTGGFLQLATNTLTSITDPTNGVIGSETQALQNQSNRDQAGITADQGRISALQASLQAQMARADALIATLQQQNTFLQGLFQFNTSNNQNAGISG